jgi:DinB superfamily
MTARSASGAGASFFPELVAHHLNWNGEYAHELVRDVPDDLWTRSGGAGLENHPAWTLGHLTTGAAVLASYLGCDLNLHDDWKELFLRRGPGDPRLPSEGPYPDRRDLWDAFHVQRTRVIEALPEVPAHRWHEPQEWRFEGELGTLADCTLFMCLSHESMHLGQLAAWRRHFGLPSALGRMPR